MLCRDSGETRIRLFHSVDRKPAVTEEILTGVVAELGRERKMLH